MSPQHPAGSGPPQTSPTGRQSEDATRGQAGPDARLALELLTDEQRMLVTLRDELYEGRWDLFVADLEARIAGAPYVFEIGPASARLKETITHHLGLISDLRQWEERSGGDPPERAKSPQ